MENSFGCYRRSPYQATKLFCPLINPRADQSNLLRSERFGRRTEAAGSAPAARTTLSSGSTASTARRTASWSSLSTRTAASAGFALRWHGNLIINLRNRDYEEAFFAVAGNDYFAVLAAFQRGFKAVEAQIGFLPLFAVAAEA